MADLTYEHLPPERQHQLVCRRLIVAEEDHFRAHLTVVAPNEGSPADSAAERKRNELAESIKTLRSHRDDLEKKLPHLKNKRPTVA